MKLFLASQIKHPQSLKALENFVDGFEGKKLVYIPTAANGEEGYGVWKTGGSWKVINTLGAKITPLVLEECYSQDALKPLTTADIIWVGGGYWGYLMYWLRRHELDEMLPKLLKEGKIYVGSSAGANVTSKSLDLAEWFKYNATDEDFERGAGIFPGLGLVDFDIYPHYKDELYDYVVEKYTGKKMYLLKDGESLEVTDGIVKVNGKERIIP